MHYSRVLTLLVLTSCVGAYGGTIERMVRKYSLENNVPYAIVMRLIEAEGMKQYSVNENPNGTKDHGIMSLNDLTIEDIRSKEPNFSPYSIEDSIRWGCRLLKERWCIFYNWKDVIGSWNVGIYGWIRLKETGGPVPYSAQRLIDYVINF